MRVRWLAASIAALVLVAGGGYAWLTNHSCAPNSTVAEKTECEAPADAARGAFDPVMAGVCQFSCATQTPYETKDVVAQPGAIDGRLTRCPVSGVVFTVGSDHPRSQAAGHEYVLCCDQCRIRFAKSPDQYVRA